MNLRSDMDWKCLPYHQLTLDQLHDILQLRAQVFVLEQNCAYQDIDGYDKVALHLMGTLNGKLLGYARLFPANIEYHGAVMPEDAIIGRVVSHQDARGTGIGHQIITQSIKALEQNFGASAITISAQERLVPFYNQHGFMATSDVYLEDNLPHIRMRRAIA